MLHHPSLAICSLFALLISAPAATPPDLAKATSRPELEAIIAAASSAALKQALRDHADAVLAAAARRPHVEAVLRAIAASPGKVERTNATPAMLQRALGGPSELFDTLTLVDLAMPNAGPHDHRKVDPYDAAFFEHLGHLTTLESLSIIATKLNDDWIPPLGKLSNLKALRLINNGKLTDAGLEKLAGLKNLEAFSYIGTAMQGHAFVKFNDWARLTRCSFRGSSIDDEGLKNICERFPQLESLVLAHAKFTDAGAPHLARLTQLKGLELGTHNATPASLQHITALPLEYLQLGEGFDSPVSLPYLKPLKSLKRLTLTNCKTMTDDDLRQIAALKQVENLELGSLALPEARVALLKDFAHLKVLRLVPGGREPFSADTKEAVKKLLPAAALKFD